MLMDSGIILFITLAILASIALIIQYFIWKSRIRDKGVLDEHWNNFLDAASNNNISQIAYNKQLDY